MTEDECPEKARLTEEVTQAAGDVQRLAQEVQRLVASPADRRKDADQLSAARLRGRKAAEALRKHVKAHGC